MTATMQHNQIATDALLRELAASAPPGCHCGDVCMVPMVMGRPQPCRRRFEETLSRITATAIEASQQEIALAFDIKFGSPTERMIGELGLYARHLATWTCDEEEFGNVRPLRDLLADAALTLSMQAKLGTAGLKVSGTETDEPNAELIDALRKIDQALCAGDTITAIAITRSAGALASGIKAATEPCAKVQRSLHG